ncbi:sugar phosphate nucleotidyltransferase, partial [Fusobacterium necrophorum]
MNAIIIAAGIGNRLRPLTYYTPKPLIKVFGKSLIERNIEYLLEIGIKEIIIVVGYMKDEFFFLEKKYREIKLIFNDKYKDYNNIYSLYLAKDYLKDTYILEGDIFLKRNIFKDNLSNSCYLSKKIQVENNEWQLIEDNLKIVDIEIGGK